MENKFKAFAEGIKANPITQALKVSAQEVLQAGQGVIQKAQEEGGKALADVAGKAGDTWEKMEQKVEERVLRRLTEMGVPSPEAFAQLQAQVAQLQEQLRVLQGQQQSVEPPGANSGMAPQPEARWVGSHEGSSETAEESAKCSGEVTGSSSQPGCGA